MLTPSDIQNQEFSKSVFGGYVMAEVDEFLEKIFADYESLYKENAVLKSKLKVLVDKVEEYRSTEDSLSSALLTAQKTAEKMIEDAKAEREKILSEADAKRGTIISDIEAEVADQIKDLRSGAVAEEQRLEIARKNTSEFMEKLRTLYSGQLDFLSKLASLMPEEMKQGSAPAQSGSTQVNDTVKSIEETVEKLYDTPAAKTVDEPTVSLPAQNYVTDNAPTIRSKFDLSDLQFGSNYKKD